MMRRILLLVFLGYIVGGCAIGNTHRYDLGDASFNLNSDKTVAVTTVDIRPYIRSGDKSADFVGLMRTVVGIPYNITTDSGQPLADDITASIVGALKVSKVRALGVTNPPDTQEAAAREALLATAADRFAMLLVKEWKTNTYVNTGLAYDLSLSVLQPDGSIVAVKNINGSDNLGSFVVPADARVDTEKAFRTKLETLFGDPGIKSALQ